MPLTNNCTLIQSVLSFFLIVMVHSTISSQTTFTLQPQFKYITFRLAPTSIPVKTPFPKILESNFKSVAQNNIPKYTHQAFFCKMEDKIYLKTNTNVKINLGSNSYVNYLEGKNKYY
jgi:hypothetical protein